jgi:ferredoxin
MPRDGSPSTQCRREEDYARGGGSSGAAPLVWRRAAGADQCASRGDAWSCACHAAVARAAGAHGAEPWQPAGAQGKRHGASPEAGTGTVPVGISISAMPAPSAELIGSAPAHGGAAIVGVAQAKPDSARARTSSIAPVRSARRRRRVVGTQESYTPLPSAASAIPAHRVGRSPDVCAANAPVPRRPATSGPRSRRLAARPAARRAAWDPEGSTPPAPRGRPARPARTPHQHARARCARCGRCTRTCPAVRPAAGGATGADRGRRRSPSTRRWRDRRRCGGWRDACRGAG